MSVSTDAGATGLPASGILGRGNARRRIAPAWAVAPVFMVVLLAAPGEVFGRVAAPAAIFAYTHLRPDGNRWMPGRGALPNARVVDIALDGEPAWLVAAPSGEGAIWTVVLSDGRVRGYRVSGSSAGGMSPVPVAPARLPAGMPPLLRVEDGRGVLVTAQDPGASPLTHPIVIDRRGRTAHVSRGGDLVISNSGGPARRLNVRALPDARPVLRDGRMLVVLSHPTSRYGHGVLGDRIEAGGLTFAAVDPLAPRVVLLPEPDVVEGLTPLWADLEGAPGPAVVVTISNARDGSRIALFTEDGRQIAAGPPIGRGFRWRHPLAAAPFGPDGEHEIAVVRTPHIGGVVEFYRLSGGRLTIVAEVPGFTSHVLGSRNLDMGAAGDFDGDGQVELLVPAQDLTSLGGIRRTATGATVAWTVPLAGRLATNVAAVALAGGRLAVGAASQDRVLRIWLPQ